jgi:hypothetical protein
MDELSYRNIWISIGVSMAILFVGTALIALVFGHVGEPALVCLMLVAFVGPIILLHVLDYRELRRLGIDPRRRSGRSVVGEGEI